jgi:hypothetical protein
MASKVAISHDILSYLSVVEAATVYQPMPGIMILNTSAGECQPIKINLKVNHEKSGGGGSSAVECAKLQINLMEFTFS